MRTFYRIKVNRLPWCIRVPRWFAMRVWLWLPGDWHSQSAGAVGGSLITRSLFGDQEFHALPDHTDRSTIPHETHVMTMPRRLRRGHG